MEVTAKGERISFGGEKNILNVMVAQLCNILKYYSIICFKKVDCVVCELYLSVAVVTTKPLSL